MSKQYSVETEDGKLYEVIEQTVSGAPTTVFVTRESGQRDTLDIAAFYTIPPKKGGNYRMLVYRPEYEIKHEMSLFIDIERELDDRSCIGKGMYLVTRDSNIERFRNNDSVPPDPHIKQNVFTKKILKVFINN